MRASGLILALAALGVSRAAKNTEPRFEISYDAEAFKGRNDTSIPPHLLPGQPAPTPQSAHPAGAGASCIITDDGFSPKQLQVARGSVVSFAVADEGSFTVTQAAGPSACDPMPNGADSKALGPGATWSYTVPASGPQTVYFYSGVGDQCTGKKMRFALTVTDNAPGTPASPAAPGAAVPKPGATPAATSPAGAPAFATGAAPALAASLAAAAAVAATASCAALF